MGCPPASPMPERVEEPGPAPRVDRWLRRIFVFVAWLFVACVVIQFFLVGLRVFGAAGFTSQHRDFAYLFGWLTPILVLLAASPAGSRTALRLAAALLVLFALQTFLPLLVQVSPGLAALHALNALLVAYAGLRLAQTASKLPEPDGTSSR
jgi:hypothetical protein